MPSMVIVSSLPTVLVGKCRRWNPVPLRGHFHPALRILVRNDRHPRWQRRDAAFVLAVQHDVGDHRLRGDLRDLREHRLFEVERILVVD